MSYTTTKGRTVELTPALWRGIKTVAISRFDGSMRLFDACWRQYRSYLNGAIDSPENIEDVTNWLETIAAEKVNNSKSQFYIYG